MIKAKDRRWRSRVRFVTAVVLVILFIAAHYGVVEDSKAILGVLILLYLQVQDVLLQKGDNGPCKQCQTYK